MGGFCVSFSAKVQDLTWSSSGTNLEVKWSGNADSYTVVLKRLYTSAFIKTNSSNLSFIRTNTTQAEFENVAPESIYTLNVIASRNGQPGDSQTKTFLLFRSSGRNVMMYHSFVGLN